MPLLRLAGRICPETELHSNANCFDARAIENYQQALDNYPQEEAEKGDFQYHLGEAQYKSGDKINGKQNLIDGIKLIEKYQDGTDSFLIHVWTSGGYMRKAECLYSDFPNESQQAFIKAKDIINSDDRLVIRKRQLIEIEEKLKTHHP